MKTRLTMKQMVKEIFFEATNGKRTIDNYCDGMYIIDTIPTCYYRWYIEKVYNDVLEGRYTARVAMINFSDSLFRRNDKKGRDLSRMIDRIIYS